VPAILDNLYSERLIHRLIAVFVWQPYKSRNPTSVAARPPYFRGGRTPAVAPRGVQGSDDGSPHHSCRCESGRVAGSVHSPSTLERLGVFFAVGLILVGKPVPSPNGSRLNSGPDRR